MRVRVIVPCVVAVWLLGSLPVLAVPQAGGVIRGRTTTQGAAVILPGVQLTLFDAASERKVAETTSDERGRFEFRALNAGTYGVRAVLAGFDALDQGALTLASGQVREVDLDLALERAAERVDVVGKLNVEAAQTATAKEVLSGALTDLAPLAGDNFQALLPVLPGVVRASDGRINMKGGRSNQSGLQVGGAVVTDPVTGEWGFALPPEAVVSVDVQPNPYAAELGRFQSGVATIETRSGSNEWRFAANGLVPVPKMRHYVMRGIGSFGPRLSLSGAPVKNRLFLHQSVRYQILKTWVPSQPEPREDMILHEFESFTRVDVNVSARHALTASVATVLPWRMDYVTLNTFNPQEVTPTFRQQGYTADVSSRSSFGAATLLDASFVARQYDADVFGQGHAPMEIGVDGNRGNFFNEQSRHSGTLQGSAALTLARHGAVGEHLAKVGVDVLRATFDGRSDSRPVLIRRADGSLSQQIEFSAASRQQVTSTDVALFAQDRWRATDRVLLELGARADKDGVLGRWGLAPRVGTSLVVLPGGRSVLRGGIGVFYGRTPLNVGAFQSYETPRVTRFAADGRTPLGPPVEYSYRAADGLRTPYGLTWNVEFNQRLTSSVAIRVNHLRRYGRHEFILDPAVSGATSSLVLDSRGRSRYHETEVTARYSPRAGFELTASYVRSQSRADLNAFDAFFGNVRNPIVRPNEYATTGIDVPNRLIVRGEVPITAKWSVSPLIELRNGFPFSLIDENQDFVGSRNTGGRFPNLYTLDFGVNRLVKFRKRPTWIGIRIYHLLNTFTPRDVQNNIHSGAFGYFYNTITHKAGFNFYIQP